VASSVPEHGAQIAVRNCLRITALGEIDVRCEVDERVVGWVMLIFKTIEFQMCPKNIWQVAKGEREAPCALRFSLRGEAAGMTIGV